MVDGEVPGLCMVSQTWNGSLVNCLIYGSSIIFAHTPPAQPILLVVDSHCSHYNPSVINKTSEKNVIAFVNPNVIT